MSENPQDIVKFRSLVFSISSGRGVIYAKSAFCKYVGLPVEQVVGRKLAELAALTSGEVSEFFAAPHKSSMPNRLLANDEGRVFEPKTAAHQGVTDVIFDEVSASGSFEQFLSPVASIPFDQLDEATHSWSLTPAYDLTFSAGILQRSMKVAGEVWPSSKTMETLCLEAGLTAKEYNHILQTVKAATLQWSASPKNPPCPTPLPQKWNSACKKCVRKSSETDRNKRSRRVAPPASHNFGGTTPIVALETALLSNLEVYEPQGRPKRGSAAARRPKRMER
jgi:hypothetical protein